MKRLISVFLMLVLVCLCAVSAFPAAADEQPHDHDWVPIPAVEPTCTETGLTEGTKCSICGKIRDKQEVIPALDHLFIAWYPNDRGHHIMVCKRQCGYQDVEYCLMMTLPQKDAEAASVSFCPICGYREGAKNMSAVSGIKILSGAPHASLRAFSLEPEDGNRYLVISFEYHGELVQPGAVSFSLPDALKGTAFALIDADGNEQPIEKAAEGTLDLDFSPAGKDPVKVIILKEI